MRRVASSNEFFDILDKIGNGKFVTIGYVTGANLNLPKVSRKNPLTNRMKGYPDYTVFGSDEEIGALVSVSSYNFQYLNRETVNRKYGEYKQSANDIRANFGLDPIGSKQGYKQGTNWSPNGPEMYNGNNDELQSHSYNPQNMHGVKPKGVVYAVNKEGHIIKELSQEEIKPYLASKREIDGVAALRKMGAEEDRIQDYIEQITNLKFKYKNFESNSILWIAATINGEKIVYINDNLNRAVDGINIRPEDFRAIARERYQIDLNNLHEMTMKKLKMLTELDWRTYDSASRKADHLSNSPNISSYEAERRKNQSREFRQHCNTTCDKQYGVDKIKDRENQHRFAKATGKTKDDFKHTNGELKRLDRQSNDIVNYHDGKQEYKDGKWVNKESKEVNMAKDIYRLTESELKAMIKESTMKILSELDWRTYASAAKKNDMWRKENPNHRANQWNRSYDFRSAARDSFDKKHGLEHQFDEPNSRFGGDKGSINLNTMDDFSVTGSRDHDFGDGDPHGLRHNAYHMGKKYGKDGGYGRTRMWDTAHETTPEKFYGSNEMGKKFRDAEKDAEDFNSGKSHYVSGKGWSNESKNSKQVNERIFSPDELDDKAFMDDYWADRQKQMDDDWQYKNIEIRKRYPGHTKEWYDAMLDVYQIGENKEGKKKALTEIGDTSNGQYAMGKLAARQQYRDKNSKAAWKTSWMAGDQQSNDRKGDNMNRAFHNGKMDGQKEFMKEESFQNNQGYSHFAVNKATNKIVNGWDYSDYDPSELRQFKNDYFTRDLIDYDLDPKQYKIVTGKYLLRQGIDPNDNNNWANN